MYDIPIHLQTNISDPKSESNLHTEEDDRDWLKIIIRMAPCISVFVYTFSYGAGFGPAIYTWTSELFPSNLKGVGSSIALSSRNIVVFVVLLFYQPMIDQFGLPIVFWTHAVIMFLGNIFVFFAIPETRGLTMTQLNEMFGGLTKVMAMIITENDDASPGCDDNEVEIKAQDDWSEWSDGNSSNGTETTQVG